MKKLIFFSLGLVAGSILTSAKAVKVISEMESRIENLEDDAIETLQKFDLLKKSFSPPTQ